MLFDKITPFVRFVAEQNMSNSWVNDGKEIVGYDHRIYYVLQGHGSIQIGKEHYDLQPDTFIMWRSGIPYRYLSEKANAMICITCNFDFTSNFYHLRTPIAPSRPKEFNKDGILEKDIRFTDHEPFNKTVFLPNSPNIRALMVKLEETYTKKQKFYSLRCNNVLQEILIKNNAIANMIREGKTAQIYSALQTGGGEGMQTLEASLANLYKQRLVTEKDALAKSQRPDELRRLAGINQR